MRKLLLATTALLALSGAAKADVFVGLGLDALNNPIQWNVTNATNLSLSAVVPGGNQPLNVACIICAENQPQQPANFGFNDYKGNGNTSSINAFSTSQVGQNGGNVTLADNRIGLGYSVGAGDLFRLALLGRSDFVVGIDVNDTNVAQTLNSFWFLNLTTHTVLASYVCTAADCTVPSAHNGTGFPDYTLSGFDIDRNDIHLGDQIIFFARMTGLNDGPDSFFLTQAVAAVPEPATWAMMLLGFAGVGLAALRKRRQGRAFRLA